MESNPRKKRARPEAIAYNAKELEKLAVALDGHAQLLRDASKKLGGNGYVKLNHTHTVVGGLLALRRMLREFYDKIDRGLIGYVTAEIQKGASGATVLVLQDHMPNELGVTSVLEGIEAEAYQPKETAAKKPSANSKGARTPETSKTPRKSPKK